MSYTTLYRVYKTVARSYEEYRNSWLSAPPIWDYMMRKHLNDFKGIMFNKEGTEKLWKLARNQSVPLYQRIVLATTYDYAIIKHEHVLEVAEAMDKIHKDIINEMPWHTPFSFDKELKKAPTDTHWSKIAVDLRQAKKYSKQIGWGLGMTSVSDPWSDYTKNKECFDVVSYVKGI